VNNEIIGPTFTLRWPQFTVVVNDMLIGTGDNLELTFRNALPKEIEMLESTNRIELVKREVE